LQTVAVLSAMYGVTNKLIEAAAAALKGDTASVARLRGELHALHRNTLQGA
jgi:aspartokinase